MNEYIKNLLGTQGWREVEKIMNAEILRLTNEEIDESMPSKEYKICAIANKKSLKSLKKILHSVGLAGVDYKIPSKRYQ